MKSDKWFIALMAVSCVMILLGVAVNFFWTPWLIITQGVISLIWTYAMVKFLIATYKKEDE